MLDYLVKRTCGSFFKGGSLGTPRDIEKLSGDHRIGVLIRAS